jgi:RimJ/RimL family protein N-acetyltransferase
MEYRLLTGADAVAFQELRLRSLRDHPEAFGASYEEEAAQPQEEVARQLDAAPHAYHVGALEEGRLLGVVSLFRFARQKTRHKAVLGGMFVLPEARGRGVGRGLLGSLLALARGLEGLEDLTLAVTEGNEAARQLYLAAGFVPYGVEPRYIRVGGTYYAIEWMHMRL